MRLFVIERKVPDILQTVTIIRQFTGLRRKCNLTHFIGKFRLNSILPDKKDTKFSFVEKCHINQYIDM